ncbi:RNA polymerase sigma factor [Tunicatimonas pelagia]|uniref:RNA polymerase sigma factor n=1 Tax=Tunicatimonas pelagia TaxID=931531 RepID=UPI0026653C9C|nr:sigma-70 family RNA polymerase sigma factor [Tunicatimonas pelagia]WKN44983.1 sigma-70 family RNA polymerase sigma factor [Tunicatimonas pelagia]
MGNPTHKCTASSLAKEHDPFGKHTANKPWSEYQNCEVISDLQRGDHAMFTRVTREYNEDLKRFAQRELKSEALAEDAVQEVFSKLWQKRSQLDPSRSLRGFLFTCLKNYILNAVRTRQNDILKHYHFSLVQSASCHDTEHAVTTREIEYRISRWMSGLSVLKQRIVQLGLYGGHSNAQIAQELGVSVTTVKIYLSQTSRQLRHLIQSSKLKVWWILIASYFIQ